MNFIKICILLAIGINSCEKAEVIAEELKTINYKPTQCSEPWDVSKYTDSGNLSREARFTSFLKDNGIAELVDFKNTKDGNIYCMACTCPSSDNFSFKVSAANYEKLKSIEPFKTVLK
jgi:hypothetical protein